MNRAAATTGEFNKIRHGEVMMKSKRASHVMGCIISTACNDLLSKKPSKIQLYHGTYCKISLSHSKSAVFLKRICNKGSKL